jgi:hypothetical protein
MKSDGDMNACRARRVLAVATPRMLRPFEAAKPNGEPPADAAIRKAWDRAGSMARPPEDMTETPDLARKTGWTRYPTS